MILADNPASPAMISGTSEERVALEYLGAVWGILPNIIPVDTGIFGATSEQNSTLYITRQASAMAPDIVQAKDLYPQATGEQLILLQPVPNTELPLTANSLQLDYGNGVQLVGWEYIETTSDLPPRVVQRLPRANWQIVLYWQTRAKLDEDYTISVRPLVEGQIITSGEEILIQDHQPVWSLYPTSQWRPNEVVRDVYALTLPSGVTPDSVQVIAYRTIGSGFENLGEYTIDVGTIESSK